MFNYTPLLGAQSASPASQSILEFDGGIKILIDVGWDENFDVEQLKEIEKHVPTLSFVLLTHATVAHIGAFAHCCKHFPLFKRVPVYATEPVVRLGRTLLQDLYASSPLASSTIPPDALSESSFALPALQDGSDPKILLQAPTAQELAEYFTNIITIKYSSQEEPRASPWSPPVDGLLVTAFNAGHTLGGTIWHLQYGMESVVYAVNWNQAREHVVSGAAWVGGSGIGGTQALEQLRRPTAMICSSQCSDLAGRVKQRDDALLDIIGDTVSKGGSVLIPSDSSARVLELAYILESKWQAESLKPDGTSLLKNAKLFLASRSCGATMRQVRNMLEWMTEGINKEFESASGGQENSNMKRGRRPQDPLRGDDEKEEKTPFDFRHINLLERKSAVQAMLDSDEPRVILASDSTLEWGFSREAIKNLASDRRNLVILTERIGKGEGLGGYLWDLWYQRQAEPSNASQLAAVVDTAGDSVTIQTVKTVALEGDELHLYQQYLATQRQLRTTALPQDTAVPESPAAMDDFSSFTSDESDNSDVAVQGKSLNMATLQKRTRVRQGSAVVESGPEVLLGRNNVHDWFVKGEKGTFAMFPYDITRKPHEDEFGEYVRAEDFVRAEQQDELAGNEKRNGATKKENAIGEMRKWGDDARDTDDVAGEGGAAGQEAAEDVKDTVEGPSKVVIGSETLDLHCRVSFVDFSGLHDKRALQMIIPLIKPRKLILVAGEEDETTMLAEEFRKSLGGQGAEGGFDVFTPTVGVVIDASVDTNAWTSKLSRDMQQRLAWQKVQNIQVVPITGLLKAASLRDDDDDGQEGGAKKRAKLEVTILNSSKDGMDTTPILDVLPSNMALAVRSVAQPFHVGDLRLAELRRIMQENGMTAEFKGEGTLVINGTVAVRKTATGKIEVEGGAYHLANPNSTRDTFWKVKKTIYEGLAVIGGGVS